MKLIVGLGLFAIGFGLAFWLLWPPNPIDRLYEEYNNIIIFEDGSWQATTHDNKIVTGCSTYGLCRD